jgi:hypothetical protein
MTTGREGKSFGNTVICGPAQEIGDILILHRV